MAFPRLNALSYWLYAGGSITMLLTLRGRRRLELRLGGLRPAVERHELTGAGSDMWIMALALTGFSPSFTG